MRSGWFGAGAQCVEDEENPANDNGRVGDVEVGPVVVDDADLEEVRDHAEADAVPDVANGPAEDESERDRGGGEAGVAFGGWRVDGCA